MSPKPRPVKWDTHHQSVRQLVLPLGIVMLLVLSFGLLIPVLSGANILAVAVGVCVFLASFASTEIALFILIFSMLLSPEFVVGTTSGAALERGVTLRLDDFLLSIIGLSWLAKMSIKKELGLFLRSPLNKPIAYYLVVCLISTMFGAVFGEVHGKTGFLFLLKYFEYIIVYFMVINYLENRTQARRFLWALLMTCVIVAIIGIAQIPAGGRVSAPFEGVNGEPNTFGGYLVFMTSITTGLLLTSTSPKTKLLYGLMIFLFVIPLLYTQSRSSYLAMVPALITFIWLSDKKLWPLAALILIGISLTLVAPRVLKERMSYTFTQARQRTDVVEIGGVKLDTSTSARIMSWKDASKDWFKHPFFGFGVTGYRFIDAQYVRVLTETGFLGFMTFFLLLTAIYRHSLAVFREAFEPFSKGLSMGFIAGFIGLLFHGLGANTFIIVRIMEPFWFITAIVIMLPNLKENA